MLLSFYRKYLKKWWSHSEIFLASVPRYEPTLQVLNQIKESNNAILSIAHPNFSFKSIEEFKRVLPNYVSNWINAIEINSKANLDWVTEIIELSNLYNLFLTFWSDCHFVWSPDKTHWDLGNTNPFVSEDLRKNKFNELKDFLDL